MSQPIDYQILLQETVLSALAAAQKAKVQNDVVTMFVYYDILDTIKTQAELMEVPLAEIGLADVDLDELIKTGRHYAQPNTKVQLG